MLDEVTEQAIEDALQDWFDTTRFSSDPRVIAPILEKVRSYVSEGEVVAPAHMERAYTMLVRAGQIKPFAGALGSKPTTAPPTAQIRQSLTAEDYNKMPTHEIRRLYKTDSAFKAEVDKLIAEGKI